MLGALWLVGGCGLFGPSQAPPPAEDPAPDAPSDGRPIPADATEIPAALRCPEERRGDMGCWRYVPGATVRLGAQATDPSAPGYDPDAAPQEGPVREVVVEPFWMLSWVVGAMDYRRCVDAGWCRREDLMPPGPMSTIDDGDKGLHPAVGASWAGAARYCAWMSARLPTEAEWELVARGVEGRRFPWGDEPRCPQPVPDAMRDDVVPVYASGGPAAATAAEITCAYEGTTSFVYDAAVTPGHFSGMAGNVVEWTADDFAPAAGAQGKALKAQRGSSYMSTDPLDARATARGGMDPDAKLPDVGFRCVWTGSRDG